ncbi:MAG TPA: LysM peptidoglycan-binding domain-containing protein [candidate division Zixibacteria bacterium]|nr:LysM peptidoglycan-binding domain-containing protein [candidate division Zixibacteria bacterium]
MKRSISSRHWILFLAILLVLGLAACERPLQEEIDEGTTGDEPNALESEEGEKTVETEFLPSLVIDPAAPGAYPGPAADGEVTVEEPVEQVPAAPEPLIYEVQSGDTLVQIAVQFDVAVEDIAAASGLVDADVLEIGQRLVIPVDGVVPDALPPVETPAEAPAESPSDAPAEAPASEVPADQIHIVQSGDNLYRIGLLYGCTHGELAVHNSLANPDSLEVGQEIRIPICE